MKNTKNQPLFSIITICYNSELTIARTFDSILSQDFDDFEYIIVDGGSSDETLNIIKKYEPLFKGRMHWKSEPDNGLYDAFNKGIERSHGLYCWNVNSDDYIEPYSLSNLAKIIAKLDKNNLPVIIGAMNVMDCDNSFLYKAETKQEDIKTAFQKDYMIPHPATIVPKYVYDNYGHYDIKFKICADKDWFHRIYALGVKFVTQPDIVLSNFVRGGISTNTNYIKNARDHWLFIRKKYPHKSKRIIKFLRWTFVHEKKRIKDILFNV